MRKGIISKFSMGVALAAAAGIFSASAVRADLDGAVTYTEPAGTLVMPFDNTTNHVSYQIVTRVPGDEGQNPVATHWSYWSDDCQHLVDVFICLTADDTVVVDPTSLQGEVQTPNPPANVKVGAKTNLTGKKGVVTVTAFQADTGASGLECHVSDPEATVDNLLVGSWTVANTTTNAAFGNDAIGLAVNSLPDAGSYLDPGTGGIRVLTYKPTSLTDSAVIALGLKTNGGNGEYVESEVGPIGNPLAEFGGNSVCCNTSYVDNLEIETSLPDFCFKCAGDHPITQDVAEADEVPVIPASTVVDAPGFIQLTNCEAQNSDGVAAPISDGVGPNGDEAFIFVYHGEAVGPFGTVVKGKYSGAPF